jgi:uncharacterized protein YndB with AHSA1/START domain
MSDTIKAADSTNDREIIFTRLLDAPSALVYEVWTTPEHLLKWWGPDGFTQTFHEFDLREGGTWRLTMHGPDGRDYPNKIYFKELRKPELIVFQHSGDEESEGVSHETTITLLEKGGKTELNMRMLFTTAEEMQRVIKEYGADEGGKQHLAKLTAYINTLTSEKKLILTRTFDAPIGLVFQAFSEAEKLAQWWGPNGMDMKVTKLDFQAGGTFLYSIVTPDGHEMWGLFVYHEIRKPDLIVFVNSFSDRDRNIVRAPFAENWPLEVKNTITLIEQEGKTLLTLVGSPINATEDERKMFEGFFENLEQGFKGTFDQLEAFLADKD